MEDSEKDVIDTCTEDRKDKGSEIFLSPEIEEAFKGAGEKQVLLQSLQKLLS